MQRHPHFIAPSGPAGPGDAGTFAVKTAAFYAAVCGVLGMQMPVYPVWLAAKGLDASDIGLLLAIPFFARVISIPLVSREADRRDALRGALVGCVALSTLATVALGLGGTRPAIFILFLLAALTLSPALPLLDAYTLRGLAAHGRAYGPVRLWGSLAFIVGTLCAGWLMDALDHGNLIWALVAAMTLASLTGFFLAPLPPHRDSDPSRSVWSLWHLPGVALVIVISGLIQASHATYYSFSVLAWQAEGYDSFVIGILWATGVAFEVVLFAYSVRLQRAFGPTALMMLGGAGATLRWSAMAFDPPGLMLPFLQALHALSYAATYLGTLGFVMRVVPPRLTASAQGAIAIVIGIGTAAGTALSGVLYESYGSRAYAAMVLFALAGLACAIVAHRRYGDRA
jgi:PPP family 3-phenylpropionic acid transporter